MAYILFLAATLVATSGFECEVTHHLARNPQSAKRNRKSGCLSG